MPVRRKVTMQQIGTVAQPHARWRGRQGWLSSAVGRACPGAAAAWAGLALAVMHEGHGEEGEPDDESARGVARVGERDGRLEDALARAHDIGEGGEVVVHALLLDVGCERAGAGEGHTGIEGEGSEVLGARIPGGSAHECSSGPWPRS